MVGKILMTENDLSMEEIENLSYYDFMSYLGVPFFHLGGLASSERLAELCNIDANKSLLMVGCGAGFSACHIAKVFGCSVVGVDIAETSIEKAKERAQMENVSDRVEFLIGDAYNLPFEPGSFDAVITEFVSQFLDNDMAFREFERVLKPGGFLGVNELYKDNDLDLKASEDIRKAEQIFSEITGLDFMVHTPVQWRQWFEKAGFEKVQIHKCNVSVSLKDATQFISSIGGFVKLSILIMRMTKYMLASKIIRKRLLMLDRGKRLLLRKRSTSKHVGYILGVGKKSH